MTEPTAIQLAMQAHQAGDLARAEAIYRQILVDDPDQPDALHMLGMLAGQKGELSAAAEFTRRAIRVNPDRPISHYNLGLALNGLGKPLEAIASFRQAIALKPDYADAHADLGITFKSVGRLDEAIASFQTATALNPNMARAHHKLGLALQAAGQTEEAIASYRQAIRLRPDWAEAHYNLSLALADARQSKEAVAACRQAIRVKPDFAEAQNNLGILLQDTDQFDESVACLREAIRLRPGLAQAHNNLAMALNDMGQVDEAISEYRQAIAIEPGDVTAHDNLLFALNCHAAFDPRKLLDESRRWNVQHAEPLRQFVRPHANNRDAARKLRIGYVSPDFRNHPVSRFVLPLLAAHDHAGFEIFGYTQARTPDRITAKIQACCDAWRNIFDLSDEQAADMMRADNIDILVDLAGHTAGNRLLVFARKPAPVQATWLGYPGTTGLGTMDYRLTDALADPPGVTDTFCSEQLVRLPTTNWCFQPPVTELPALANGRVTFGSFNNFAKVNEPLLKLWAKILRASPGAHLLLKAKSLRSASVQQHVREVTREAGIEPDRLELIGWAPSADYLAPYHRIDIALDTYPYHGTTTTCESFWMGVPVVTLAGESHLSRVGVSLLSNVGLADLIADTPDQYVQIAVELANDVSRLTELRHALRAGMQASPLMDGARFARDVESAYRQMWICWTSQPQ